MSEHDGMPAWVWRVIAAATYVGIFLLSAAGAFPQEASQGSVLPVHKPTAGVIAPVERMDLGTHYQLDDVGRTEALSDGSRVLRWLAEQRYCVPLMPRTAEYLNSRVAALNLVGVADGETATGAYLVFMSIDGQYGEVWLVHDLVADTEFSVTCLVAVMVYAPDV